MHLCFGDSDYRVYTGEATVTIVQKLTEMGCIDTDYLKLNTAGYRISDYL
jgi:hypothetical protein